MVSAYAAALRDAGVDVSILMPAYPAALERAVDVAPVARMTGLPGGDARLLRGQMPDTGVPVLLLQMDHLFAREGLYRDPQGRDYLDNLTRFASLAAAAARVARGVRNVKRPDIVHAHDWHAGLTPLYLRLAGVAAKSVFTIHNLAFQGNHPLAMGGWIGVPPELLAPALSDERSIEFYGSLSMMKAGIVHSDRVTTVSRRYAREILTPHFGHRHGRRAAVASRQAVGHRQRHRHGGVEPGDRQTDRAPLFRRRHRRQAGLQARTAAGLRSDARSVRAAGRDRQPPDRTEARRCRRAIRCRRCSNGTRVCSSRFSARASTVSNRRCRTSRPRGRDASACRSAMTSGARICCTRARTFCCTAAASNRAASRSSTRCATARFRWLRASAAWPIRSSTMYRTILVPTRRQRVSCSTAKARTT